MIVKAVNVLRCANPAGRGDVAARVVQTVPDGVPGGEERAEVMSIKPDEIGRLFCYCGRPAECGCYAIDRGPHLPPLFNPCSVPCLGVFYSIARQEAPGVWSVLGLKYKVAVSQEYIPLPPAPPETGDEERSRQAESEEQPRRQERSDEVPGPPTLWQMIEAYAKAKADLAVEEWRGGECPSQELIRLQQNVRRTMRELQIHLRC